MICVRRPKSWPEWYEPIDEDYPGSYQLTSGGMGEVAAGMAAAGLIDERAKTPELPDWPPPGISPKRAEALSDCLFDPEELAAEVRPKERPIVAEFLRQWDAAAGARSADPALVPAFKFFSNDGWLVTPEECRLIADGLTRALAERRKVLIAGLKVRGYKRTSETVVDLLEPWAAYNRLAADHGGYRVW